MSGVVVFQGRIIPAGSIRVNDVRRRTAAIAGRSGEPNPQGGLSFGGFLRGAGKVVGGFLTGGALGAAKAAVSLAIPSQPSGAPSPLPPLPPSTSLAASCPEGFRQNPSTGVCEKVGVMGGLERILPGGRTGTLPQTFGDAVIGAFGTPALMPAQFMVPTLRCPAGMVLGKDSLCYPKQVLGARGKWRKHPADRRPPVTAADAAAIRRAAATTKRVQSLAKSVGLRMTPKRASSAPKRKK